MPTRISAVHRTLIFRLTLAAILLSAILGTGSFYYEWYQLQKQIMEMVRIGIDVYRAEAPQRLAARSGAEQPAAPSMDNLARNPPHTDLGRFVFVALYDTAQREVGHITDGSVTDIRRFQEILDPLEPARSPDRTELGSVFRFGKERGIPFVVAAADDQGRTVGYVKGVFVPSPQTEADIRRSARRAPMLAILFVFVTALFIYPIIRSLIARLEKQAVQLVYANVDTLKVLGSAIAKRDSDTDAHNYRVTFYSVRLAEAAGLDEKHMRGLIKGAFLHDVGKIAIRDSILLKPGSLDSGEYSEMQSHVRHGLDIVENASWLADAAQVVGGHHEKYDGSGYPNHLGGEAIPLTARIFAIADVFDALTSERPYKKSMPPDEALAIMRQDAGRHFDPVLFAAFEPLAPALFAAINLQDEALHRMLNELARRYFSNVLKEKLDEAVNGEREQPV